MYVCDACSPNRIVTAFQKTPVRVCGTCYDCKKSLEIELNEPEFVPIPDIPVYPATPRTTNTTPVASGAGTPALQLADAHAEEVRLSKIRALRLLHATPSSFL